jgi:hypothetical protein
MPHLQLLTAASALALLLPSSAFAQTVNFEQGVWPIFESSCVKCHGAEKAKAGLRLDGKAQILSGSEGGPVIRPGNAKASELFALISLPADDDDIMPAKGKPLTVDQIKTIERWIEQGAKFGEWKGVQPAPSAGEDEPGVAAKPKAPAGDPPQVALIKRLGMGLGPAPEGAVAAVIELGGQVTEAIPGSPLLRVQFISSEKRVDDHVVAALTPLRRHITQLNLAKTQITDAALAHVAAMPKLSRLDLHQTEVSDQGVRRLVGLSELRYLNLYNTDVGDGALDAIANLANLQAVFLWQTGVTDEGVAKLRAQLPKAKVQRSLDLPQVETRDPEASGKTRKRKRKKKAS